MGARPACTPCFLHRRLLQCVGFQWKNNVLVPLLARHWPLDELMYATAEPMALIGLQRRLNDGDRVRPTRPQWARSSRTLKKITTPRARFWIA